MKIRVSVKEREYFRKMIILLNDIPPFNKVRPKELQLYAELMELNHKHRYMPFDVRNKTIFDYQTRQDIAANMGIQVSGVYNLMKGLRKAGLITKNSLVPKYLLPKSKEVTFKFIEEE